MEKSSKLEYFIVGFLLLAIVTTGALWLLRNRDQKINPFIQTIIPWKET